MSYITLFGKHGQAPENTEEFDTLESAIEYLLLTLEIDKNSSTAKNLQEKFYAPIENDKFEVDYCEIYSTPE